MAKVNFDEKVEVLVASWFNDFAEDNQGTLIGDYDRVLEYIQKKTGLGRNLSSQVLSRLSARQFVSESRGEFYFTSKAIDLGNELSEIYASVNQENNSAGDDKWQPLPIDRNSIVYIEALAASEEALSAIKGDNGYTATQPVERDEVVATLEAGIESIKTGNPPRSKIEELLLKPLKFIAEKFSSAALGEVAKSAVAYLIKLMSTL